MPPERSRDLAIPPGSYVQVLDRTKGHVSTITGPNKTSLADNEVLVIWRPTRNSFDEVTNPNDAVQANVVAAQGQYVVLNNPAKADGGFPQDGKNSTPPALAIGDVVNLTGPVTFALWWQQSATVIPGHKMRSNHFLVLEVTNEKQARENWSKAVVKKVEGEVKGKKKSSLDLDPNTLTMGQRIVICGTDASFFIPPTGLRVVPESNDSNFVREAVTLESLQYCVLLDENGTKRYVQGPAVVFPTSTEVFVESDGKRVFRAIELNAISGIHVMVIADYTEGEGESKKTTRAGTELFITGKEQAIYFPRPEHAIIKYGSDGKNVVQYATAVPAGEGRYVLSRETGEVTLARGPKMLLPNPIDKVFTRRVLDGKTVALWFPGNQQAIEVNRELARAADEAKSAFLTDPGYRSEGERTVRPRVADYGSALVGAGDEIRRKTTYTPPRTVTLGTKFDGAVAIGVWAGYAIEVVAKDGKRRVVKGPQTVLLEYDEELTRLSLSTGKPKSTDQLQETVYLKVAGNQVSDIVRMETKDGMEIEIKASFQVEFVGDGSKWFVVDNYVKLVTDHLRSILRGVARSHTVSDFMSNATVIIRDAVLGLRPDKGSRPGCLFPQVDARVYDVEVLAVRPTDSQVASLITNAQKAIVSQVLALTQKEQEFEVTKRTEEIDRALVGERAKTQEVRHQLAVETEGQKLAVALEQLKVRTGVDRAVKEADATVQEILDKIAAAQLAREKADADQRRAIGAEIQALEIQRIEAETSALQARMQAIPQNFVAAIEASNDRDALVKMAEQFGLAAYLRSQSVGAAVQSLLAGTPLEGTFGKLGRAVRGESE